MLDKKNQLKLAKFLTEYFSEGDWQELFTITDCEDVPDNIYNFYRHVHWNNPELKGAAITATQDILARKADNLSLIWELDRVQQLLQREHPDLYHEIDTIVNLKGQRNVSASPAKNVNLNIYQAIADAETLLIKNGPQYAYDRIHTALHASLRQACINHSITVDPTKDNVPGLIGVISEYLNALPDSGRNADVFRMMRSARAILHEINNLRNNNSMAHPTENLLNEADARFAINLVRSIMTYIDELLDYPSM